MASNRLQVNVFINLVSVSKVFDSRRSLSPWLCDYLLHFSTWQGGEQSLHRVACVLFCTCVEGSVRIVHWKWPPHFYPSLRYLKLKRFHVLNLLSFNDKLYPHSMKQRSFAHLQPTICIIFYTGEWNIFLHTLTHNSDWKKQHSLSPLVRLISSSPPPDVRRVGFPEVEYLRRRIRPRMVCSPAEF